ncbi:MAG: carotenoid 1,2-hydratase [Gemmatimonadetes bacterium]|nr:carotenoid 1,2-hydratase [Gemmatimonadota bacterium]
MVRAPMARVLLAAAVLAACGDPAVDRAPAAGLSIGELLGGADTLHARAIEPREFTFPRDHGPHPEFRTEWWYFTGNLTADDGTMLGYQLTFFRSALTDSASFVSAGGGDGSAWRARHAYMAHFAVTDGSRGQFHAAELFSRDAAGLAGALSNGSGSGVVSAVVRQPRLRNGISDASAGDVSGLHVWLHNWSAISLSYETLPLRLRAVDGNIAIDLVLEAGKPVVLQGDRGLSRKGAEPGNASYYYSLTRMPTFGSVRTRAGTWTVTGASWLDREWSTSVLSPGVTGWDWLSLQLSDFTELMMYRLRRDDRTVDPFSAATFVAADGSTLGFTADEFVMTPVTEWRSGDGVSYPIGWRIEVPSLDLALDIMTPVPNQELDLAVRYWEGMVRATGTRDGRPVSGRGYLEMTGYAATPGQAR